ncbi:hypothetical protein DV515_00007016 [Chloebia gouldiae]|uniref:Uncharacterized protein n=1 Tax=Chloebia gouldiae TaxID=44316 RepID=A0A3L8SKE2_CHLGU|nr:hypothetical protein DV515_00007016 [Chloebia gouldiae]
MSSASNPGLRVLRFILQPKGVIHNQLLEKQRIAEEKIKELEVMFAKLVKLHSDRTEMPEGDR